MQKLTVFEGHELCNYNSSLGNVFTIDDNHNAVISAAAETEQQVSCDLLIARENNDGEQGASCRKVRRTASGSIVGHDD